MRWMWDAARDFSRVSSRGIAKEGGAPREALPGQAFIANTFYWIDVKRGLCAVIMMQFLPSVDREAVGLLRDFERAVYA